VSSKYKIKCPCGKVVHYDKQLDVWIHEDNTVCEPLASYNLEKQTLNSYKAFDILSKKPDKDDVVRIIDNLVESTPDISDLHNIVGGIILPLKAEDKLPILNPEYLAIAELFGGLLKRVFNIDIPLIKHIDMTYNRKIKQIIEIITNKQEALKKGILKEFIQLLIKISRI